MLRQITIAEGFPPGLNTTVPATDIGPGETADGYGFDLAKDGRIAKGTIPTGTARIQKTVTIGETVYYWHYGRLWLPSSAVLYVGAPHYDNYFYPQGLGRLEFNEDANNIIGIVPFAPDYMAVFKSTGMYVVGNCADQRGFFQRSDVIQQMNVAASTRVAVIDNAVFCSNASGLFMFKDGTVTELTRNVRDSVTTFAPLALTVQYDKKRVICGTTGVYDMEAKKLFKYNGSAFRYTSPRIHNKGYEPFTVERVYFHVEHGDEEDGHITWQVRLEDQDWSPEFDCAVEYNEEQWSMVSVPVEPNWSVRKWQLRITDIQGAKYIKSIAIEANGLEQDDYTE